jgi:lysyl-tRNA synthetase class 1
MTYQIIGHGTWYDKMASEIIQREQTLKRNLKIIRTESGIGASGFPHIGSLADATRSHAIALALENQNQSSELIAFSDDRDGLRKIPAGFPDSLKKYIGYPVTSIPDPFGSCHTNFGDHMSSLLLDALDACQISYTFLSANEIYKKGILNEQIELLLRNAQDVGRIVAEEVDQDKYETFLPYFPVCQNCGRIYTTQAHQFVEKEHRVLYHCNGMDLGNKRLDGCGFEGEMDYRIDEGKLAWKAEFAARWAALQISFEAYGKDISDSVRVNDRICRDILHFEPPLHVQYEVFLDKSGKKISKSKGNVFTPQRWFKYGSPQSLLLLTLKRFTGTRALSVQDIPQYMNELDDLEDIYFQKKPITDLKERAKLTGLFLYCWNLQPPQEPRVHIAYNVLLNLARVAPPGSQIDFIKDRLHNYGYPIDSEDIDDRIQYALNWIKDIDVTEDQNTSFTPKEIHALQEFTQILEQVDSADEIQEAIFTIARRNEVKVRRFFQILYQILLGTSKGPRLGPYILDLGKEAVIKALSAMI